MACYDFIVVHARGCDSNVGEGSRVKDRRREERKVWQRRRSVLQYDTINARIARPIWLDLQEMKHIRFMYTERSE